MSPFKPRADFDHQRSFTRAIFRGGLRAPTGFVLLFSLLLTWIPMDARAESMAATAFEHFLKQSGLASPDDVLWSEVPCNDALCVQAGLQGISRSAALRQFSQIVAGFGYGVNVHLVRLTTSAGGHSQVDLEVQFRADASKVGSDEARQRAWDVMEFLKLVGLLSPPQTAPFDPSQVEQDAPIFFLYEISWDTSTPVIKGTLLAPPGATAKRPNLPKTRFAKSTIELDGKTDKRPFVKWNRVRLQWQRVCEGTQGGIQ